MQLSGFEAVKRQIVVDPKPGCTRPASYDLTIGEILVGGRSYRDEVSIEPQQTFIIVSQEQLDMKAGFVGYAMPKTGLCNEGILALNTGLIDPGFKGTLSTIAINFSRDAKPLAPGKPFLRIVVNELTGDKQNLTESLTSDPNDARKKRSREFPVTFLDTSSVVRKITEEVLNRHLNTLVLILAGATIVFALWNLGAFHLLGVQANSISAASEARELRELDRLETRMEMLEATVYRKIPSPPGPPSSGRR